MRDEAELRALVGEALPGVETHRLDRLDASPKGDGPGFMLIDDDRTRVIPDRVGNRLVQVDEAIEADDRDDL